MKRLGLRPRLFAVFLLVALVPLVLLSVNSYQRGVRQTLEETRGSLERVSRVQQRRLNTELERLRDGLALVASRTQMRLSLQRYTDTGDQEHLDLLERILEDALRSMKGFVGIWIRDASGNLVTGVATGGGPRDFPGASRADAPAQSPVRILWDDTDRPRLWLTGPLTLEGQSIGTVHILARCEGLSSVLGDFSEARVGGRTLLLINGGGGRILPFDGTSGVEGIPGGGRLAGLTSGRPGGAALPPSEEGLVVQVKDQLLAVRPLRFDVGHVLVYTTPSGLDKMLAAQLQGLLLTAALALVLSTIMALVFSRMISRPVEVLTRATKTLREGGKQPTIQEPFWGEFTELTRSFNFAMDVISRRTDELSREVEARRRSQRKLADLANTDPLTGLVNRRHFMGILTELLQGPVGSPSPGSLLYIDLDGFKPVNDRLGHEAGDVVLEAVAGRLRHLVRERDVAARIGGDEFALLLVGEYRDGLNPEAVAGRAEEQLSQPLNIREEMVRVGCSIGVVTLHPGEEAQSALNRADAAMYRVKAARQRAAV